MWDKDISYNSLLTTHQKTTLGLRAKMIFTLLIARKKNNDRGAFSSLFYWYCDKKTKGTFKRFRRA